MSKTKSKILTICHDAGGAEIVSAYVKKQKDTCDFACLVAGPAVEIFKRKKLDKYLIFSRTRAGKLLSEDRAVAFVLTGTGWGSSLELDFIKTARRHGVESVAYLEHWVNIRERFNYPLKNWRENLPDAFWAGNSDTRSLARRFFPDKPCKLVPNLYYKEMQGEYKKIRKRFKGPSDDILFMSQPIKVGRGPKNHRRLFMFSEYVILKNILDLLVTRRTKNKVVICFHPSESKNKYDRLIARYQGRLCITKQGANRIKDIVRAGTIIGITSTILAIAKLCDRRKKVISFVPDKKILFPLPFKDILRVRNIKQLATIL